MKHPMFSASQRRPARRLWHRWVALGATVGLTAFGSLSASAAPPAARSATKPIPAKVFPPPPQVRDMSFLLGRYNCRLPTDPTGPVQVSMSTKRSLDGHYYDNEVRQYFYSPAVPDVHGRGVYGWDPVNGTLILQYQDNWGSSGTAKSPGWQAGHLRFAGVILQVTGPSATGIAPGIRMEVKDDYVIVGPGHFTLDQTVTLPDGVSRSGSLDCRRP